MDDLPRIYVEQSGQTITEYALILGLVVVVLSVLVMGLMDNVDPLVESFIDDLVFRINGIVPKHLPGAFTHF